jgi:hypothetical protein
MRDPTGTGARYVLASFSFTEYGDQLMVGVRDPTGTGVRCVLAFLEIVLTNSWLACATRLVPEGLRLGVLNKYELQLMVGMRDPTGTGVRCILAS